MAEFRQAPKGASIRNVPNPTGLEWGRFAQTRHKHMTEVDPHAKNTIRRFGRHASDPQTWVIATCEDSHDPRRDRLRLAARGRVQPALPRAFSGIGTPEAGQRQDSLNQGEAE